MSKTSTLLFAASVLSCAPPTARADGPFRFTNVTASSRFFSLRNEGGHGVQWADVNGDGLTDVYVTNIFAPNEDRPDLFFVNQGGGVFHERGAIAGISDDGFFG